MSDDQTPEGPSLMTGVAATPAGEQESPAGKQKLSLFLRVSILLLVGLTLASISLLFIGDFEGRIERVFSTFALFGVFVVFTAVDTNRERSHDWYAPVALIANTYILGLLLIVIWMTPYSSLSLMAEIVWKSFLVIAVTRLVILCCEILLRSGVEGDGVGDHFAFGTSVLAVLSGVLFTAPAGIAAFSLHVPDMYWKIATAVLILTALGLSVTVLLRWANGAEARAERRRLQRGRGEAPQYPIPVAAPGSTPLAPQVPGEHPVPVPNQVLLPWPTFADGRPIPARPDGQPDFSVPGAPQPPQL